MSASQNKKKRVDGSDAMSTRAAEAAKSAAEMKKYRTYTIIVVTLFILAAIVAILFNSNLFYTKTAAVEVNGTKYSAADFNFFYVSAYNEYRTNVVNAVGEDYASYFMPDATTSLAEQYYDEESGTTWRDYFTENAKNRLAYVTAANDAAEKEGFTLTEDQQAELQSELDYAIQSYSLSGTMNGQNLDWVLEYTFGEGMTEKIFRENYEKALTAAYYAQSVGDAITYSDSELDAYYAENADELDYFRYTVLPVYADAPADDSEAALKTVMEAAEAEAKELAAQISDDESFSNVTVSYVMNHADNYGGDVANQTYNNQGSQLLDNMKDWMTDPSRQYGDTEVFSFGGTEDSSSNGYYVVMFKERNDNSYASANAYVIHVNAESVSEADFDSDEKYNEAVAAAKKAAEDEAALIQGAWQNGVSTPEELLSRYTDNSQVSSSTYEDAARGDVDANIVEWLFDEPRAEGDSTVVETDSGYDVVLYTGKGDLVSHILAETALKNDDYAAWQEALVDGYTAEEKWSMRFTRAMLALGGK